jgi:hypothetical protein
MKILSCSSRCEEAHFSIMFYARPHPNPLPPPSLRYGATSRGEGTAVACFEFLRKVFKPLTAFSMPEDWKQFSLSQRERAGVREN